MSLFYKKPDVSGGGVTWPLESPDGSSSSVQYSFASDSASGMWYSSAGSPILAIQFDQSQSLGGSVIDLQDGYADMFAGGIGMFIDASSDSIYFVGSSEIAQFDMSTTAGDTRMLLWDVNTGSLKRVLVGANDSGGAGYRLLRIVNS